MAQNDIYNSKLKYETFKENLDNLTKKPGYEFKKTKDKKHGPKTRNGKYYCKNPTNLKYFRILFDKFEAKDLSYIRRNKLLESMKLIVFVIEKDLAKATRDDMDKLMVFINKIYTPRTRSDFIADLKYLWKILLPEKDNKGRIDDTIVPYAVRHLSRKIDRSREEAPVDRLKWEEFENLVNYFSFDKKMQFYLTFALESLGRPQEILFTKIKDLELYENHAVISVSSHGKEGIKNLICIDSFPYLLKYLAEHPLRNNPEAFLFIGYDNRLIGKQLTPKTINQRIRTALKCLGISKSVTCYSIKRNGITFRLLRGESPEQIRAIAGWTSTKMLSKSNSRYNLREFKDALEFELMEHGLINPDQKKFPKLKMRAKACPFCNHVGIAFNEDICPNCKHILNREKIQKEKNEKEIAWELLKEILDDELKALIKKKIEGKIVRQVV